MRLFKFILGLSLVISLVACGNNSKESIDNEARQHLFNLDELVKSIDRLSKSDNESFEGSYMEFQNYLKAYKNSKNYENYSKLEKNDKQQKEFDDISKVRELVLEYSDKMDSLGSYKKDEVINLSKKFNSEYKNNYKKMIDKLLEDYIK